MNTILATLLQATAAILMNLQGKGAATPVEIQKSLIQAAERSIQLSTQAVVMQTQPFASPKNATVWPTAQEVVTAAYKNIDGGYTAAVDTIKIDQGTIMFGDLNGDGKDDAAAVVYRSGSHDQHDVSLAMLLNQNDILFNIASLPLMTGTSPLTVATHTIANGKVLLNGGTYELFGNRIYQDR